MRLEDREPAVAGMFYEGNPASLRAHLKELFREAKRPVNDDEVAAVIVPHAGYIYSGEVAASGFNQIPSGTEIKRIFLIGSSHKVAFKGASVYSSGSYVTPLGKVKIDMDVARELIESSSVFTSDPSVHLEEHSLEVELPFLQYHLKQPFKLVPIIMGPHDAEATREVARVLSKWFCKGNLFVISSDFSHYPSYEDAREIDAVTAGAILKNSSRELLLTLDNNEKKHIRGLATSLCGWTSVLMLLHITEGDDNLHFEKIEYRNSGDVGFGDKSRVVGYNAIAVFRRKKTKNGDSGFSLSEDEKKWLLKRAHETLHSASEGVDPDLPEEPLPENLKVHVGAFVSLYKDGALRGCIGNFGTDLSLWKMVDQMTIAAALNDSRFLPVTPDEVDDILIELSVLTPMRKVDDVSEIIPGKHGIFIEREGCTGTFLPQVAVRTGWSTEELLGHCARDKAGIGWDGWKEGNVYVYEALIFGDE
jgi:AmmeMemoRadiSam system protein B/AmmeMemoRadiSam system protein A